MKNIRTTLKESLNIILSLLFPLTFSLTVLVLMFACEPPNTMQSLGNTLVPVQYECMSTEGIPMTAIVAYGIDKYDTIPFTQTFTLSTTSSLDHAMIAVYSETGIDCNIDLSLTVGDEPTKHLSTTDDCVSMLFHL